MFVYFTRHAIVLQEFVLAYFIIYSISHTAESPPLTRSITIPFHHNTKMPPKNLNLFLKGHFRMYSAILLIKTISYIRFAAKGTAITVISPATAIDRLLMAPSISPSSRALAVPMA